MSAVIVKGIIISLSLAAAVGIALQSPEVKEWLDEQRRRLAELLRNVSEGLDPQTRREAEAFAYEGRMPTPRERDGMVHAATVATGSDALDGKPARRTVRQSNSGLVDAEERRRLGREYLAKRNQELLDLRKRKGGEKGEDHGAEQPGDEQSVTKTPDSLECGPGRSGDFDHLVNEDGSLRVDEKRTSMASEAATQLPSYEAAQQSQNLQTVMHGTAAGALFANPFADEFAMSEPMQLDRAETPKPVVPPKIVPSHDTSMIQEDSTLAMVEDPPEVVPECAPAGLTYEEQLARALSLSLAENDAKVQQALQRTLTEQEAFERAIEESLRVSKGPSSPAVTSPKGPLVDFSSDVSGSNAAAIPSPKRSDDEELYTLSPMVSGQQGPSSVQYSALTDVLEKHQATSENATSYDFPDVPTELPSSRKSVEAATDADLLEATTPTSGTVSIRPSPHDVLSTGYQSESETDDFASLPDSTAHSEASLIEVEELDMDSVSDDDDGIRTPQSWSEVGSDAGESERSESEAGDIVHV